VKCDVKGTDALKEAELLIVVIKTFFDVEPLSRPRFIASPAYVVGYTPQATGIK